MTITTMNMTTAIMKIAQKKKKRVQKMKPKKIPMRRCTGCMMMLNKNSLIRVVKAKSGEFSLDFSGKKSGRGAYICPDLSCFNLAKKAKRLRKILQRTGA
jgi:predicted RNA-binding protein YlxR (DUF448 family)